MTSIERLTLCDNAESYMEFVEGRYHDLVMALARELRKAVREIELLKIAAEDGIDGPREADMKGEHK